MASDILKFVYTLPTHQPLLIVSMACFCGLELSHANRVAGSRHAEVTNMFTILVKRVCQ